MTKHADAPRTIHVTYRNHSRFARVRLIRPAPLSLDARITALLPGLRAPEQPADYTPELAMELIAGTCELPESKRALHVILGEYRRALHALATQTRSTQPAPALTAHHQPCRPR